MLPEAIQDKPVAAAIEERYAGAIIDGKFALAELTLWIDPAAIAGVCGFLKHELEFVRLSAVTAVDWYPMEPRFEVVYQLHSIARNERLRLKCRVGGEVPQIDSVTGVWEGADWYEREVFDLFGIQFRNHPNLRRIMMPEYWEGYPLRKDFPVHGHKYTYQDE